METTRPHRIVDIPEGQEPPRGFVRISSEDAQALEAKTPEERAAWLSEVVRTVSLTREDVLRLDRMSLRQRGAFVGRRFGLSKARGEVEGVPGRGKRR